MKNFMFMFFSFFFVLSAAHAGNMDTRVAYYMNCVVYDNNANILGFKDGSVTTGNSFVVYEKNGVQYVAGAEEGVLPNGDIAFRQMDLMIVKDEKVIARAMADFDPEKMSKAIVSADDSLASLSCVQKQK